MPRTLDGRVVPASSNAAKKEWTRARGRARRAYLAEAGSDGGLFLDLRFHDLRHEATSRLAVRVPNVIELSKITGHRSLEMLKRYYHTSAELLAAKLG